MNIAHEKYGTTLFKCPTCGHMTMEFQGSRQDWEIDNTGGKNVGTKRKC